MSIIQCSLCEQTWDTKQHGECPTCRRIRESDLAMNRVERTDVVAIGTSRTQDAGNGAQLSDAVALAADEAESQAKSLSGTVWVVTFIGVLAGAILILAGFIGSSEINGFLVTAGIAAVLFWILIRSLGMALAAKLKLSAVVARWEVAEPSDDTD
jgi:hypothetical protein